MSSFVRRWLPLAFVAVVALWLRTHELARRPMHADEANQAVKLGHLLEQGDYAFDPRDHHGPTLYYFALVPAWLRGQTTLAALTETTVRLTPALFGVVAVLLTAAFAAPLGRWPAVVAAAFVALSPPAVYYSRYFVQETLLVTFTLGALVCGCQWWTTVVLQTRCRTRDRLAPGETGSGESPGRCRGWAVAGGACAGLMLATKATTPLLAAAAGVALLAVRPSGPGSERGWRRDLLLALGAALSVAALFYSSFGTNLAGLRDALATYAPGLARVASGGGHEKPWWYYASLFLFHRDSGYVWDQSLFLGLALAGFVIAWFAPGRLLRFAAVYTAILAAVFSLLSYKTPWMIVNLVPGLAVLAAGALAALARQGASGRAVALALLAGCLVWQGWQTQRVVFKLPSDPRNPFAYVHSAPDVLRVRALAAGLPARSPAGIIKVISEEYWPLPWYLRDQPRTGYWTTVPADCDAALVIASASLADAVRGRLHGAYRESYLGLRPGFVLVVFTPETR